MPISNTSTSHDITPVKGRPASSTALPPTSPGRAHYPVEALCLECGQPIRCERWFLGGWVHIERFSNPRSKKEA